MREKIILLFFSPFITVLLIAVFGLIIALSPFLLIYFLVKLFTDYRLEVREQKHKVLRAEKKKSKELPSLKDLIKQNV